MWTLVQFAQTKSQELNNVLRVGDGNPYFAILIQNSIIGEKNCIPSGTAGWIELPMYGRKRFKSGKHHGKISI